jgi:ankyrin repeat protein
MPHFECADPVPRWRFLEACKNGDVDCVTRYVETVDHRAYLLDDTALNSAVSSHHPEVLRILLEAGTDPNLHGEHVPALHVAAADDTLEAAVILVKHGAKIDTRDAVNNDTALMYGVRDGKAKVAEYLLTKGANPNLTDRQGFTPLHIAASRNDIHLVRCLLAHGASIDARSSGHGRTALLIAAMSGFTDMVRLLLEEGANPSIPDNVGRLPHQLAIECHHEDIVRLLGDARPA